MASLLIVSRDQLTAHLTGVERIVASSLAERSDVQLSVDWDSIRITGGLFGADCERVTRNRGPLVYVAPLLRLRNDLWAWLGYREEWDSEVTHGKTKYAFRSIGITVHFGWKRDAYKPQMFRAEWAGWARWQGSDCSFQAGPAGHPHWQFDALESLADGGTEERARLLFQILEAEEQEDEQVREFMPGPNVEDVKDAVFNQRLSRIHFASAAAWWRSAPWDAHAHGPSNTSELQLWIKKCLAYLSAELGRLQS